MAEISGYPSEEAQATGTSEDLDAQRPPHVTAAPGYSDPSKWESRYEEQEGTFDWYATYKELGPIFREFCPPAQDMDILMLGCGNSAFSGELYEAGYEKIINIDIAEAAVKKMQEKFAELPMEWHVMDATAMTFEDCRFKLAVDKGTLDAMMHGGSAGEGLALDMVADVWRTLQPGGVFLLVSHNGLREDVANRALLPKHGPAAQWQLLDRRKCALSPQSMLINILRSKLNGRPLIEGFKDPDMLREASVETRFALKQMQFLEAFRLFKAKKEKARREAEEAKQEQQEAPAVAADESEGIAPIRAPAESKDESEDEKPRDSRRQLFCWVYVLQKPQ
jgi:SAM-dependent methyltransferase